MAYAIAPQPSDKGDLFSRTRRWRLFLFMVLWPIAALGCGTVTYITEVIRNQDNTHSANVSLQIEIDKGVFDQLKKEGSTFDSTQAPPGWTLAEKEGGRITTMSRRFATLPELQQLPQALAAESADTESLIQATDVQVREIVSGSYEYVVTTNLKIPNQEPAQETPAAGDDVWADLFNSMVIESPELKQAIEAAGQARFVVEVLLPGTITETLVNTQPGGEITLDGRARWTLTADKPGAYVLQAKGLSQPTITLDRVDGPRFSAIKVTGRGFQASGSGKRVHVNLFWEGQQRWTIETTTNKGELPETWIWIPEDAAIGVNKVWAEEGESGKKSNEVAVTVGTVAPQQLLDNLDTIFELYLKTIPPNAFGWTSGAAWNMSYAAGIVTDVRFRCGWYQAEVLIFLNGIRFDPNPANRAKLDGLAYGPMFSGLTTLPAAHAFAVIWPYAPALAPELAQVVPSSWETGGIALDPWPRQKPEFYLMASGSGDWATNSIYSARWLVGSGKTYLFPTPIPEADKKLFRGEFPITGGAYYAPPGKTPLATLRTVDESYGQPKKALIVRSPVRLEIRDNAGHLLSTAVDQPGANDIPSSEVVAMPKPEGGVAWYVALPEGEFTVTLIGTGDGEFHVITKNAGQPAHEYPPIAITTGATATLVLTDDEAPQPIQNDAGQAFTPTLLPAPPVEESASITATTPVTGTQDSSTTAGLGASIAQTSTISATVGSTVTATVASTVTSTTTPTVQTGTGAATNSAATVPPAQPALVLQSAEVEPNLNFGKATPIAVDTAVQGALFPAGDADWYLFEVAHQGELQLTLSNVDAALTLDLRVWNANKDTISGWLKPLAAGGDTVGVVDLPEAGRYYLEIVEDSGALAAEQPYTLQTTFTATADTAEPNNGFGSATPLTFATPLQANILPPSDADWYAVTVDHHGQLTVSISDVAAGLVLDLRVWNANKDAISGWFKPQASGGDTTALVDLPTPGSYFLEVIEDSGSGRSSQPYTIQAHFTPAADANEPNNNFALATPLTFDTPVLVNLLPQGDADWYRVEVAGHGELTVAIADVPAALTVDFRVWNANKDAISGWFKPLAAGGGNRNFVDLPAAGSYYLEVVEDSGAARAIEPFSLTVTFAPAADPFEPNNSFGKASNLGVNRAVPTNLLPAGDSDWHFLEVTHQGELQIIISDVPADLTIDVRVWNANKDTLSGWIKPLAPGGDTVGFVDLPEPGRYYLEVVEDSGSRRAVQPFTLQTRFTSSADNGEPNDSLEIATPVTLDTTIPANILPANDADWCRLALTTTGELHVLITNVAPELELALRLWDESKQPISGWVYPLAAGGDTTAVFPIAVAGVYYLEVVDNRSNRSIQPYLLRFSMEPIDPASLVFTSTVTDTLTFTNTSAVTTTTTTIITIITTTVTAAGTTTATTVLTDSVTLTATEVTTRSAVISDTGALNAPLLPPLATHPSPAARVWSIAPKVALLPRPYWQPGVGVVKKRMMVG